MSLPKVIYVFARKLQDGSEDLYAYDNQIEAIDEDGPTVVGEYRLVRKNTFRKQVVKVR